MKTYFAERLKELGEDDDVRLLKEIEIWADHNDFESCHVAAQECSKRFDVEYRRGQYVPGFDHSWCVTKHGNVVDVYPVGMIGGPVLVSREVLNGFVFIEDIKKYQERVARWLWANA